MRSIFTYISGIFKGVWSLIQGMRVTGKYFFSPGKIVTQRYPENRNYKKKKLVMLERFKGVLILLHDAQNQHRCTGCGICDMNCPNGTINVITNKITTAEGKSKRVLDKYVYHLSMCTFCGLCVKTCPSNALAWGQDFEHAVFDRHKLTKVLNNPGSTLVKDIAE
ncbi:MAG: 4Fe-4S binding protein [Bacteroidota bacterium]